MPLAVGHGFRRLAFKQNWSFHESGLGSEDVRELLAFHFAEMQLTSPPEACHVLLADGLSDPAVTFWSLRQGGELLGVGALRELAVDHGEVKSMRTAPASLGRVSAAPSSATSWPKRKGAGIAASASRQ